MADEDEDLRAAGDVAVKMRIHQGPGIPCAWALFLGKNEGRVTQDGSVRQIFSIRALGLRVLVPPEHVIPEPTLQKGKRPSSAWHEELLKREPLGCSDMGLNVAVGPVGKRCDDAPCSSVRFSSPHAP